MAYVPQFIPTNTEVLQGTLNQYQQASDLETNRQNQVNDTYSAIPTAQIDAADKNAVMGQFSKVREELDKKYNYDRANTQYASELANKITELRSNPLWGHLQQKEELNKMRQQLIANKGADYHENFNPNSITVKDANKLQEWKPMDLKDMERQVALSAKEHSTSIRNPEKIRTISPGILEITNQTGFPTIEKATDWLLNDKKGQAWLEQSVQGTGFEGYLNDPKVRSRAINAALSQLVGEPDRKIMGDPSYDPKTSGTPGGGTGGTGLVKVYNQSPDFLSNAYPIKKASDESNIDSDIQKLKQEMVVAKGDPIKTKALTEQIQAAQIQKIRVDELRKKVESTPEAQTLIKTAKDNINKTLSQYKTFIAGDKSEEIYDILRPYFVKTTAKQRKTLFSPFGSETKVDMAVKIGDVLGKYTDPNRKVSKSVITGIAREIVNDMEDWYKGKGNYPKGYENTVEDVMSSELRSGEKPVYDVYAPDSDTKSALYKQNLDFVVKAIPFLIPKESEYLRGGEGGQNWDKNKLAEVQALMSKDNTSLNYVFDNQDHAYIQLSNPGDGKKSDSMTLTLEIDPDRSGLPLMQEMVKMTGDKRFLDPIHSTFQIAPNTKYSLDSKKETTLKNALARHPYFQQEDGSLDMTGLEGISVKEVNKDGRKEYELYLDPTDTSPDIYPNKGAFLEALYKYSQPDRQTANLTKSNMNYSNLVTPVKLTDASDMKSYFELIGLKENAGKYGGTPNKHTGALGKYQFLPSTLQSLGYDSNDFLDNPAVQDQAMQDFTMANIDTLRRYGYNIDPNRLTPEALALLAVSHYGGVGAAKALLENKPWIYKPQVKEDGTEYPSVVDYVKKAFSIDISRLNFESLKQ